MYSVECIQNIGAKMPHYPNLLIETKRAGNTEAKIAKRLHVSPEHLMKCIAGTSKQGIRADRAVLLCQYMGLSLEYLFFSPDRVTGNSETCAAAARLLDLFVGGISDDEATALEEINGAVDGLDPFARSYAMSFVKALMGLAEIRFFPDTSVA